MTPEGLWLLALREEHGLAITTDDRVLLRQQLYRIRPSEEFSLSLPESNPDELWVIRRAKPWSP